MVIRIGYNYHECYWLYNFTYSCNQVIAQSEGLPVEGAINIWGHDQEMWRSYEEMGEDFFKDDERFARIMEKGADKYEVLSAIWGEPLLDRKSGRSLSLDENFEKSFEEFLQNTEGRYDAETLGLLREMAQEERESGAFRKATKDLYDDGDQITKNAINRAIEDSKKGKATILDGVPLGFMKKYEIDDTEDYRIVEKLEDYLKSQDFDAPYQVALVHLHPKEMAARMEQRNKDARSAGGEVDDARDDIRYFSQYSQMYGGPNEDGALLSPAQVIQQKDIYHIAEKFGGRDGVRIRDMERPEIDSKATQEEARKVHKTKMKPVLATIQDGKNLLNGMGFEDGANSLSIGTKVKAHVVFDHEKQPTAEISGQILGFISKNMAVAQKDNNHDHKPAPKKAKDDIPSEKSWVASHNKKAAKKNKHHDLKLYSQDAEGDIASKKSWVDIISRDNTKAKDDSGLNH